MRLNILDIFFYDYHLINELPINFNRQFFRRYKIFIKIMSLFRHSYNDRHLLRDVYLN